MNEKEKNEETFKVSDKRRFDSDGDVRQESSQKIDASKHESVNKEASARRNDKLPEISFSSFVVSLATQALMQLGEVPPPPGVDLKADKIAAKQTIDLLVILREKTKGNLDKNESELLEEALYNTQMAYVRHSSVR
ncbi:MAG: DUF1844 domain-containing protein [SAR324 cluster bacterium]|uniref:DUF1844 domain-containing protein n=1 Tax=SAR324 cluster bacterium TaxID=2024889 RepID=A0A7X9IL94_9DELT|nr:DUF1844 domain-containing protein [SAR324 cluster bacterium]